MAQPPVNKKAPLRKSAQIHRKFQHQNIPELCLDAIFKHIPLENLLTGSAGQISKCWYNARFRELGKRQTLFLIQDKDHDLTDLEDSFPYKDQCLSEYLKREDESPLFTEESFDWHKFNVIFFPCGRLNAKFTSKLMQNLPKIAHLVVLAKFDFQNDEIEQVIRLLTHYSAHLIKLKLYLSNMFDSPIQPETITQLFESINRLTVLDHLKLNINIPVGHDRPLLSVLSRLVTFSHDSTVNYIVNDYKWMKHSLVRYAGGENRSRLRSIGCEGLNMVQLSKLDPQIVSKFYWLDIDCFGIESNRMIQLFSRFTSLTCLKLSDFQQPITLLAQCLAQAPSLIYLRLDIGSGQIEEEEPTDEGEQQIRIYQALSILQLCLFIQTESHEEVEKFHFAQIFPSIQVFQIKHDIEKCRACPFKRKMATFERVAKCRRLARDSIISGFHKLRSITYECDDPNEDAGSYYHEEM